MKQRRSGWKCPECNRQNGKTLSQCPDCGADSPWRDKYQKAGYVGQCDWETEGVQCRIPVSSRGTGDPQYCSFHRFWYREHTDTRPSLPGFRDWVALLNEVQECSPWTHYDPEWMYQLSIGGYPPGTPIVGPCDYKYCDVAQEKLSLPEWAERVGRPVPKQSRHEIMQDIRRMAGGKGE